VDTAAKINGKWGIINRKEQWLINPFFDHISLPFNVGGYCHAKLNGEWGVINRKGEWKNFD
jgi:hypothetical protein